MRRVIAGGILVWFFGWTGLAYFLPKRWRRWTDVIERVVAIAVFGVIGVAAGLALLVPEREPFSIRWRDPGVIRELRERDEARIRELRERFDARRLARQPDVDLVVLQPVAWGGRLRLPGETIAAGEGVPRLRRGTWSRKGRVGPAAHPWTLARIALLRERERAARRAADSTRARIVLLRERAARRAADSTRAVR